MDLARLSDRISSYSATAVLVIVTDPAVPYSITSTRTSTIHECSLVTVEPARCLRSAPQPRNGVRGDPAIVGHDRQVLLEGLGDQEPIEWVAVMCREDT
jgi:hypothetical protein